MTVPRFSDLTGPLLKQVSRSFYLTLRVLPVTIRPQISLAYLLARASDTIADTDAVPRAKRVVCLRELQSLTRVPNLGAIAEQQTTPGEGELLARLDECLDMLNRFSTGDCRLIQQLLETIITGQIFDLERFPDGDLTALTDEAELDHYTYLVAGCVGEFWTKMCQAHLPGLEHLNVESGIRFGKGLQLVNILRDLPRDLRIGRCYLPLGGSSGTASRSAVVAGDGGSGSAFAVGDRQWLLDSANYVRLRPQYQRWLDTAVAHLDAGWQYTLAIPARQWRVRLACTWPIWIGLETITLLRQAAPDQHVKVPQRVVNRLLLRSFLICRSNAALDRRYRQIVGRAIARQ